MAIIRVITSACWLGDVGTAVAEHRGADGKVTTQEQFPGMAGSGSKQNVLSKQSDVRGLLNKHYHVTTLEVNPAANFFWF